MNQPIIASKPHYPILDGLRGVAAITVVIFHIFEAHAPSHFEQVVNHGYLAVDFFFALSGYVIGYAYDDRWHRMSIGDFFKRRLVRLHPMLVMGMIVGAICFYFQESGMYPKIADTSLQHMLVIMFIGMTLIPIPPSMDIRGWQETHPLDGPAWTLFYEYIANILYALVVRKFPKWALGLLVAISAATTLHLLLTNDSGYIAGGWSLTAEQIRIGVTRVMYPFFAGLLLFRITKPGRVNNAFVWCSLLIITILSAPNFGGKEQVWQNGLYEALCIIFMFPLIVWMGASGELRSKQGKAICKFLGDISYPIYITHYALIYIYTGWVVDHHYSIQQALPQAILVFAGSILIAWLSLRYYDMPVRKWLTKKM